MPPLFLPTQLPQSRHLKLLLITLAVCLPAQIAQAQNLRLMPVGDSITEGFTPPSQGGTSSYREELEAKLVADNCSYEMVGSKLENRPQTSYQSYHEGYSSRWARHFIFGTSGAPAIADITATHAPNAILMHLGSNDIRQGQTTDQTLNSIRQLIVKINQVDANLNPAILLANVIPWYGANGGNNNAPFESPPAPSTATGIEGEIELLGSKITDAIANGFPDGNGGVTVFSNVYLVDVFDGYTPSMMQSDMIHPADAGEEFLAQRYFDVIDSLGLCDDNIAPDTSILYPSNAGETVPNNVTFTGAATDEGDSGFQKIRIAIENLDHLVTTISDRWYDFNAMGFKPGFHETTATMSGITLSSTDWSVAALLPAGRYRFYALAVDNEGNQDYVEGIGVWPVNIDFTVTPDIETPTPMTSLGSSSQTFEWTDFGNSVFQWELWVGSTVGGKQYHNSGTLQNTLSDTVNGLPTDGSSIHARLWYRDTANVAPWKYIDRQFTAFSSIQIISPTPDSSLSGTTEIFTWTPVDEAWLHVGSTVGGTQYFNSRNIGAVTSASVTTLPTDGSIVHVRLWYKNNGSNWKYIDASYTAANAMPSFTAPTVGSILTGSSQTFSWTQVAESWLYLGSTPGSGNIANSGNLGAVTTFTATGLPTDGSTIHARLWYRNTSGLGAWQYIDAQYTAVTASNSLTKPSLISPGNSGAGSLPSYRWGEISGATWYQLWVNDTTGTPVKKWYKVGNSDITCNAGTCTVTPGISITGNATWWVRGWNSASNGPWSNAKNFSP